jgi:DeoR/GlpR family transcriptional regulator of sugar metabolism
MLRHTLNGRQALTIEDLAARYDVTADAIRQAIKRAADAGRPIPVAGRCGRMALYDPKAFDRARGVSRR